MKNIIDRILKSKNIAVFTHKNADPDALGSVGAFCYALEKLNKNYTIFLNETVEENFEFLNLKYVETSVLEKMDKSFDLFVSLDSASLERLGIYAEVFKKSKNSIEIDHHKNRKTFAEVSIIKHYSSNAEIMLELLKEMNVNISSHMATCLYAGIIGDTDSFKNGATTALSLKNASEMLELGADMNVVNTALYSSKTQADFAIMKRVLERAEFNGHIAISYITEKDAKDLGKSKFLTSDLVSLLGNVKGVEISVLIKQDKGKNFRISLRSSKNYNVGEFCSRFGGGGHNQAAGMALVGSLKQVKDILLKEVKKLGSSK